MSSKQIYCRKIKTYFTLFLVVFPLLAFGCAHSPDANHLYQVSTINALLEGGYDGNITCGDLLKQGDFGIGTFDGLDGEMIALGGKIYRISSDGAASEVDGNEKSPFACVTFFRPEREVVLKESLNLKNLEDYLDRILPSRNIFYAIRLDGVFGYVKTRSVPRQNKPYPRLVDVVKNQPLFELREVEGTVVGFRCPDYIQGINVPGYHFHFITADRKSGGHVLALEMTGLRIKIADIHDFHMILPRGAFYGLDLDGPKSNELRKVEK